ncbi:MAG: diguanylate cyclase [Pseudomonadota bacterium]
MKLAEFIRTEKVAILDAWEHFAQDIVAGHALDVSTLRDHASGILEVIADDLDNSQSDEQRSSKSRGQTPHGTQETQAELHGAARLLEGFSVSDAMSEFRALRASVLHLWSIKSPQDRSAVLDDVTRFNEAIDQTMTESLQRFSGDKDRQVRLFSALLTASPDLNFIVDLDGKLQYSNLAFATRFGGVPSALRDRNLFELCAPASADIAGQVREVAQTGRTYRSEWQVHPPGKRQQIYECLLVPVVDTRGAIEAVAGSARDISERKRTEERIRRSANYDALTGLPNRSLFADRLSQEIRHATRDATPLALLFIDLDGFKEVNDVLGHAAGDQLLKQVALRISGCVRGTDTVARLGGDEFTVILTDMNQPQHIDSLAQEILAKLDQPFALIRGRANVSASIGIAVFPQDGATPDDLLLHADAAMYAAKHAGRHCYRQYSGAPRGGAPSH